MSSSFRLCISVLFCMIFLTLSTNNTVQAESLSVPISCEDVFIEGCNPNRSGGSNPLVVQALIEETYRNRAMQAAEEASNEGDTDGSDYSQETITPMQTVMPYPENIKTLGDVLREQQEEEDEKRNISQSEVERFTQEVLISSMEENTCTTQFQDIEESAYGIDITVLDCMNVVSGRSDTYFEPGESINRKEAIKMAILVSGEEVEVSTTSSFTDIDSLDWSVSYTETANDKNIIFADESGALGGEKPLTHEEALGLYLNATRVGISLEEGEVEMPLYGPYLESNGSDVLITEYSFGSEVGEYITREEFSALSVSIMSALFAKDEEYMGPTQELSGEGFSASRTEPQERSEIFPALFSQ